jgi:GT2 family glycosyltransferase
MSSVSVIIPVYNNAATLRACLDAVLRSSYPVKELIVVNDGSTDGSDRVARGFPCSVIDLPANAGVGIARNAGAAKASGDVLFFTDADVVIRRDTIAIGMQRLVEDPGLAGVVGLYTKSCGDPGFVSTFKNLVYHHVHMGSSRSSPVFIGNCGLIRRDVFESVGGFDSVSEFRACLEDVDLGFRMTSRGYPILLDHSMQVTHHKRFTLLGLVHSDLFRRAIPWSKLILKYRRIDFDNCTRAAELFRMALAYLVIATIVGAAAVGEEWWLAPAALALFVASDHSVTSFLRRERGVAFAMASVPLRLLYYWSGGLGIACALATYRDDSMAADAVGWGPGRPRSPRLWRTPRLGWPRPARGEAGADATNHSRGGRSWVRP